MRPENSRYVSCISKEARELEVHVNLHQLASRRREAWELEIPVQHLIRGGKLERFIAFSKEVFVLQERVSFHSGGARVRGARHHVAGR